MKAKKCWIVAFLVVGIILGGCKDPQDSEPDLDIHTAAMFGDVNEIKSILTEKPELVNAKDDDGYTPLHLAFSIFGKQEAIKLLIANGADVNAKEETMGATPLHFAADKGYKDIIEFLLSKGADINGRDKIGGTALHHLVQEGQEDDTDMIEFLLSKGANINAKDNVTGGTPLHYASMNGYMAIVKFLIANGADINIKAIEGATPLMLAELEGHKDVADLLRKHMKDVRDLLHAIDETGYDNKGVLVFTKRLKDIAPKTNRILGNALKQDYTFDWYSGQMLALKMAEQQFRALDMINDADKVNKAVESLETAWLESDLHEILYASFYNIELETVLNDIAENMSEEEQQQLSVDNRPVKALAERLLKQDKEQAKTISK